MEVSRLIRNILFLICISILFCGCSLHYIRYKSEYSISPQINVKPRIEVIISADIEKETGVYIIKKKLSEDIIKDLNANVFLTPKGKIGYSRKDTSNIYALQAYALNQLACPNV
ncbi:MAG: hypothetical protein AUJ85_02920 [Elusimicrobia bacterium CG1_02_37_114]|nr:MAG: hypothetical protein AUJ85_02920 [Elusimicrobia bacterium CG1_02_37_114]PIV52692.1 MAG: hypothetical protein COS17_07705 [Elusimicrobia bacterium CG02_land_8_20_14_3_00_37_13]PIZ13025.1 MAG: hypothetical protein COY53_06905 [Elusimicrobia bacterium CG_4_10_14_0_8_um_filter_37_32]